MLLIICYINIYFSIDLPDFILLFFAESEPENGDGTPVRVSTDASISFSIGRMFSLFFDSLTDYLST